MNPRCPRCHQDNPDRARFCGACGLALPPPFRRHAQHPRTGGLFILAAALGIWLLVAGPSHVIPKVANVWPRVFNKVFQRTSSRTIDLDEAKSRELYRLLAPQDVHVIVSFNDGHVDVRGSAQEVDALVALSEMLSRPQHHAGGTNGSMVRAARDRIGRTYHLPQEKTRLLSQLLRDADLSLDISDSGNVISIGACAEDHTVMDQVVKIVSGERL